MEDELLQDEPLPEVAPEVDVKPDPSSRFKQYLEAQMAQNQRRQSPEALNARDLHQDNMAGMKDQANLGSLLFDSAAKFGSVGGKQAQSGYGDFAKGMENNIDSSMQRDQANQKEDDSASARQNQLYQYLAMQQAKEQQLKTQMYNAETKRQKLAVPDYGNPIQDQTTGNIQAINRRTGTLDSIGKTSPKEKEVNWHTSGLTDATTGEPLLINNKGDTKPVVGAMTKSNKAPVNKSPEEKIKSLNSSDKQRLDNIKLSLTSLEDMNEALINQKQNTYSLIGDNDYTSANRLLSEAVGRMQSGGAIGKEEAATFLKMAPTKFDSPDIQKKKIDKMKMVMESRLQTLGLQRGDLPDLANYKPAFIKKPKPESGTATAAPVQSHPEDNDAVQWAKDNPNDPRSAAILKANGVQ